MMPGNSPPSASYFLNNKPFYFNYNNSPKIIELFPGDTMNFVIATRDTITDSVYVSSEVATVLPGATFTASSNQHQTGYIHWVASAADVSLAPDSFLVTVKDNAKPIKFIGVIYNYVRVNKPGSITLNNGLVDLNQDIELEPGTPMNLRFSSVNPALSNAFTISSNVTSALPGATFTTDNASQQTANINFTPTASQINSQPYTFTVTYQDNAPVPNKYVYTVNVKVRSAGMLGIAGNLPTSINFTAFPNPFFETVSFRTNDVTKAESILIYNLLGQQVDKITIPDSLDSQEKITWEKAHLFASGTYFARLVSKDKSMQMLKFIKQ